MIPYKVEIVAYGEGTIYIEHSFDTEKWTESALNADSAPSLLIECPNGEEVYIRGSDKNDSVFSITQDSGSTLPSKGILINFKKFSDDSEQPQLKMSGNVSSLINYKWVNNKEVRDQQLADYYNNEVSNICYNNLFSNNSVLVDAGELYVDIEDESPKLIGTFSLCSSLVTPPELTATVLSNNCYERTFESCSSLVKAPDLPAVNLADYCYYNMFTRCTNLSEAPKLPAKTLKKNCYSSMFKECTALKYPPSLPAKELTNGCYLDMFNYCQALEYPPLLPATTLAPSCYMDMFAGIEPNIISKEQTEDFQYPYYFPNEVLSETNKPNFVFSGEVIDDTTADYFIKFSYYNTWSEIEAYNKTWGDWTNLGLDWGNLMTYGKSDPYDS